MGQSPSVSVMEQSPWVHEMEQSAWDHEMGQGPWVFEIDQSPWVLEMDQSPWVTEMEQSPRVHEMEQSHWVHEMEQSPWIPGMEQSPWVLEMGQTPLHFEYGAAPVPWCGAAPVPWCGAAPVPWPPPLLPHPCGAAPVPWPPPLPPHPCGAAPVPWAIENKDEDDMEFPNSLAPPPPAPAAPRLPRPPSQPSAPPVSPVHGHFKVPHQLRQVNQAAYEPQLISIGPCHRDKEHLRDMEMIKMQSFSRLLNEKGEETMNRCLEAISNKKEKARNWYVAMSNIEVKVRDWWHADMWKKEEKVQNWLFATLSKMKENVPNLDEEKAFLVMILVDGCFIIQLLCKAPQDQFVKLSWSRLTLLGDLLLLENQLPFFVLVELYGLIKDPTDTRDFAPQAFAQLIELLRGPPVNPSTIKDTDEINHLLGLVHDNWIPSRQGIQLHEDYMKTEKEKRMKGRVKRQSIGCARELEEAGIEFIKVEERNAKSLFDVNFKDGKMKIPELVIEDNTERLFRNLIAYELFVEGSTYVIDYVTLMDNLVNTANDVQLLRSCGVIENMLGDDEVVAQMLNKLRDYVTLCGNTFFYEEIFVNVQKHCKRPWNTWKAKLRHDYFSNPWTRIAFVAGFLVFLTTITTFILSFFMKN